MALKRFDQDLLTRIFRKIVKNYATQAEMDSANERIDQIVAEGGEPNVIEVVKQNGEPLTVTDKAVDVTVPTKVSELENDEGYVTEADVAVNPNILRSSNDLYSAKGDSDSDGKWEEGKYFTAYELIDVDDAPSPDLTCGIHKSSELAYTFVFLQYAIPLEEGKSYTLSFYARGEGTTNCYMLNRGSHSSGTCRDVKISSENWTRLSTTFNNIPSNQAGGSIAILYESSSAGSDYDICGMKLEEGSTHTPWCPSYWDMENKNVDVPTKVSELENDAGYATTTQLTDGSVTKVGTATVGSPTQGIYLDAGVPAVCDELEIGGRNLILESEYYEGVRSNTSQSYYQEKIPIYKNTDYGFSLIQQGGDFTFSGDYEFNGITTAHDIYLLLAYTDVSYDVVGTVCEASVGDNSGHFTFTFTPTTAQMEYGTQWLLSGFQAGCNADVEIKLSHMKLEAGTVPTDWTPAPEELEEKVASLEEETAELNETLTDLVPVCIKVIKLGSAVTSFSFKTGITDESSGRQYIFMFGGCNYYSSTVSTNRLYCGVLVVMSGTSDARKQCVWAGEGSLEAVRDGSTVTVTMTNEAYSDYIVLISALPIEVD